MSFLKHCTKLLNTTPIAFCSRGLWEQAQKAVEAVYLEEDQRLAAKQHYLDWLRGGKPPAGCRTRSTEYPHA